MRVQRRTASVTLAALGLAAAGLAPATIATAAPEDRGPAEKAAPAARQATQGPAKRVTPGRSATQRSTQLRKKVRPENIEAHLRAFQDIADKNGNNRAVGTAGYEQSARYVEGVLRKAGYRTQRQHFTYIHDQVRSSTLTVAGQAVEHAPLSYSPAAKAGASGVLVAPATATGCGAAAWNGVDATGKIALVQRGTCSFSEKSVTAKTAGALGVIVYNNADGALNGTLGEIKEGHAPTVGVSKAQGEALAAQVAAGRVEASLVLDKVTEKRTTFNVLAETTAGSADNVILVGSHLDGAPEGPGINDNGSGSATTLEVAVQMATQKKIENKVRFAWWGAEEIGLLGSTHYVDNLKATNPAALQKIATYLNFDMVGSPNYVIGVYDADQSTHQAPVTVPEGSIQTESVFTDYFDAVGQHWIDTEFNGRSDYQAFIENGIPASGIATGAEGKKSKGEVLLFGGREGAAYDDKYHTAGDTIDNVNMAAVDIVSDAVAHTVLTLAHSTADINGR